MSQHDFPIVHPVIPDRTWQKFTVRPTYNILEKFGSCDMDNNRGYTACREVCQAILSRQHGNGGTTYIPYFFSHHLDSHVSSFNFPNLPNERSDRAYYIKCNIARWFWYIEGHMNWDIRTRISHSELGENIVWVDPSAHWFYDYQSISLFTLMLRLSPFCVEGSSINDVLQLHRYSRATLPAIWRFLNGYQHSAIHALGWLQTYEGLSDNDLLSRRLISRSEVEKKAFEISQQRNDGCQDEHYKAAIKFFEKHSRRR